MTADRRLLAALALAAMTLVDPSDGGCGGAGEPPHLNADAANSLRRVAYDAG